MNHRDTKLLKSFGKHIKTLRESKGLTKRDLALSSEVGINQIGRIERGEVNPTLCSLNSIAEALEIDLKRIVDFNK